jgi:hypothetical protein
MCQKVRQKDMLCSYSYPQDRAAAEKGMELIIAICSLLTLLHYLWPPPHEKEAGLQKVHFF